MNLHKICCLDEGATIRLPQLLLNNEVISVRLPQLDSIMLLLRQQQENLLTLLGSILYWFITHSDCFLKSGALVNWKLWTLEL